ncbi:formyltransferase family protein [Kangiella geojedonensis]|uniref:Methionyl-tRNA formyltransferase n=1 Tax=Kangiella geojedonensis TaxID=914150 RepID=A0A0F6TQS2_9GAMM|nr:formyltransferase family protein [Kangiella geojedonensis]AKE52337.1 Methionyl-tRNA formyltransferase [Kangiella geojedonensis]
MKRIGFVTCVQLGLSCMEAIYDAGGEITLAMTLTDEQAKHKSGRVYIDDFCAKHSVALLKSTHVNNPEVIEAINRYKIDWLFIIGWSQIASKELINSPNEGVLGIHPTLLPQGRGRAAIPWAILKGLDETGVTLFKLDEGVDTGPIVEQISIEMDRKMCATRLYEKVNQAHVELIKKVIPDLLRDNVEMLAQDDTLASEWPGRSPEDGQINLNGSVVDAERLIRAVTHPYPGAFYYNNKGQKVIVWEAEISNECKSGDLEFNDGFLTIIKSDVSE